MSDQAEHHMLEALDRMSTADLGLDQGIDVSRLIRQLTKRQADIQQQMQGVVTELDQVAALLRQHTGRYSQEALAAREHIASDFTNGARAIEEARNALLLVSEQLEYLRYKLL